MTQAGKAKNRGQLKLAAASGLIATLAMLSACTAHTAGNRHWSYLSPPRISNDVVLPVGGVWCETLDSATFMAQTGWFGADCHSDPTEIASASVTSVEHFQLTDVRVWVVQARVAGGQTIWIPLPDHEWS